MQLVKQKRNYRMIKPLISIILLSIASIQVNAEVDTAYIQEQARQTIAGSQQNKNRFSDAEMADIIKKSNDNSKRFSNEAQAINSNAQNRLQSNQAKRDQSWATQNMQRIESSPEHKKNLKEAYVICKNSERNAGVDLGCDK